MNLPTKVISKNWKMNIFSVIVLFLAVWAVYYPSLGHMYRGDQWTCMVETMNDNNFLDIARDMYSFPRTSFTVAEEDYNSQQFRPVYLLFMTLEKALFGTNLSYYFVVGIMLHFLVSCLLYLIMSSLLNYGYTKSNGILQSNLFNRNIISLSPLLLSLFFAVNYTTQETVTWYCVHGWSLFCVFGLGSVLLSLKFIYEENNLSERNKTLLLRSIWCLITFATFTIEFGQFLAILIGLLIGTGTYNKGNIRKSITYFVAFTSIIFLFQLVNLIDLAYHGKYYNTPGVKIVIFQFKTLGHAIRFLFYTIIQPFFPSSVVVNFPSFKDCLQIQESIYGWLWWGGSLKIDHVSILSFIALGVWSFFTFIGLRRFLPDIREKRFLVQVVLISMIIVTTAIVVFSRMNKEPGAPGILRDSPHYVYIPLLFFVLASYLSWINVFHRFESTKGLKYLFVVFLSVISGLTVFSGIKLYNGNQFIARYFYNIRSRIAGINEFIAERQDEKGFSFAFDLKESDPITTQFSIPITTILFKQYEDNVSPKYVLRFRKNELIYQSNEEYRKQHPGRGKQLFSDLVEPNFPFYNIFYYNEYYWGVHYSDVYYDPERKSYNSLVKDATLDGLREKLNVLKRKEWPVFSGGENVQTTKSMRQM